MMDTKSKSNENSKHFFKTVIKLVSIVLNSKLLSFELTLEQDDEH